jgi:hypothetical protein
MTAPTPEEVAGLCERLAVRYTNRATSYGYMSMPDEDCRLAAAALESIAAERDRLLAERNDATWQKYVAALEERNQHRATIERLEGEISVAHMVVEEARRNEVRAEQERDRLREALLRYGDHEMGCHAVISTVCFDSGVVIPNECTCGFSAALAPGGSSE